MVHGQIYQILQSQKRIRKYYSYNYKIVDNSFTKWSYGEWMKWGEWLFYYDLDQRVIEERIINYIIEPTFNDEDIFSTLAIKKRHFKAAKNQFKNIINITTKRMP